jgi:MFS family permease
MSPAPTGPKASTALVVLALAFAANAIGRGVGEAFMVLVLPLSQEFGWQRALVSSVFSVYLLTNGLGAPLTGMLIDRWGPRVVYPLGLLFLGAACLLTPHLTSIWQFQLTLGVLAGMGTSMLGMVPASMLISRWFRERMSTAMGFAYAGFGTGTIVIVPLAQHSIELQGWRDTYQLMGFLLLALLPLLLMLPWRRLQPADGPSKQRGSGDSPQTRWQLVKGAFRSRAYWQIATLFSFTAFTTFSVVTQVVPFLIQSGLTPLEAATAYGTAGLLSVFGIPASGWAGDRFGYRRTVTFSFATTFIGIAALMLFSFEPAWRWLVIVWIATFGTMQGARGPIVSSLAVKNFGGAGYATIYGTLFAWMSISGAAGGLVAGALYDVTGGYRAGFVLSMVAVFLALSPFWVRKPLSSR